MVIKLYNINRNELQDLRQFEKQYSDDAILASTENAFDGEKIIELIISSASILGAVFELILLWKKNRNQKNGDNEDEKMEDDNISVEEAKAVVIFPDGVQYCLIIKNANIEAFKEFLKSNKSMGDNVGSK